MVRCTAFGHRRRLQDLCGELSQPGSPAADPARSANRHCACIQGLTALFGSSVGGATRLSRIEASEGRYAFWHPLSQHQDPTTRNRLLAWKTTRHRSPRAVDPDV